MMGAWLIYRLSVRQGLMIANGTFQSVSDPLIYDCCQG
jgi:hypothetical protein